MQRLNSSRDLLVQSVTTRAQESVVDRLLTEHVLERVLPLGRQRGQVDEFQLFELR